MSMHAHGRWQTNPNDAQQATRRYEVPLAPAWDVGRPQRAVYELDLAGRIGHEVLDVGCGGGEHALWLGSRGHVVCGVDPSAAAIGRAQRRARREGLAATGAVGFVVGDVGAGLAAVGAGRKFDSALDAGSFHRVPVAERTAYARALAALVKQGGRAFVLCFADREKGRGGPPRVTRDELARAFAGADWVVESVEESVLESRLFPGGAAAWLLTATRR
ncbi:MAG: class I SAM-dependent methyltransferase [Polyangia bacterium]